MSENLQNFEKNSLSREVSFYRNLQTLPNDLYQEWLNKYEDLQDPENSDFFDNFDSFIKKRKSALMGSLEVEPNVDSVILKEIISVQEVIQNTFGDSNYFLNNGSTAEVYELPIAPHLCVKYINNQENYNDHNHLRTEFNFLRELSEFQVDGIRTPVPYFIQIHPSLGHSYGMERILGKSLSQLLEKPYENIDLIRLIKGMDREDVKRRLIEYVKRMHKDFKISHNDLELRNMMVDENGNFFIIDFGKAKIEEIGEDHDVFQNSDLTKIEQKCADFFKKIDNINIDDIVEVGK